MKKRNNSQTINAEELAKQRPVLTESEMRNFYTYEEAVEECLRLFDEGVEQLYKEYDLHKNNKG